MDKKIIEKLVWAGMLAPTADNCQPFRFESGENALLVHFSYERARAFLDYNNLMSWLALGCLLTNIRIMARSLGYDFDEDLFPGTYSDNLVAILRIKKAPVYKSPLLPYLEKRCSNRSKARKFVMPEKDERALFESIAQNEHVQMDVLRQKKEVRFLAKQTSRFYPLLLEHQDVHEGIYRWVRWNQKEVETTRDGFYIHVLEFTRIVQILLRLSQAWRFSRFLTVFKLSKMVGYLIKRRYKRSSAFALLSISEDKPEAYVKAGRELEHIWLEANRRGYSIHPSVGVVSLALRVRLENGTGLTPSQIKLTKSMESKISNVFPAFSGRLPVFLLRFSKTGPPSARTPRLPVSQVLTFNEG